MLCRHAMVVNVFPPLGLARGVRSGSFNISERDDKREQVSTILVNISVNEAVVRQDYTALGLAWLSVRILGLANAFYLPRFFATDLVPTGTRSFAKKNSVNKKYFPAPGGNIYSQATLKENMLEIRCHTLI